jgi:hypothetical protein
MLTWRPGDTASRRYASMVSLPADALRRTRPHRMLSLNPLAKPSDIPLATSRVTVDLDPL